MQQTHSTRIRIAILAAYGESFVRDNPGSKFRLVTHEPRPSITLIPPVNSDKRPMTYRFIEAVQRLAPNFSKDEWKSIYAKVGARLHLNQLSRVFVVLRDDDRPKAVRDPSGLTGGNVAPISAPGRGGYRPGLRKRPADQPPLPTPSKSARGK